MTTAQRIQRKLPDETSWQAAERLVQALQFEGYALYPYRPSALKNQRRWAFGSLYPEAVAGELSERSTASCEVLLNADVVDLRVSVRVLQVLTPLGTGKTGTTQPWQELRERVFDFDVGRRTGLSHSFRCQAQVEPGFRSEQVDGQLTLEAFALGNDRENRFNPTASSASSQAHHRVRFELSNRTTWADAERDAAYRASLVAAHLIVHCVEGTFVSPYDPPTDLQSDAATCRQDGWYPALVGELQARRTLICSPIIVGDHPTIAPESPGDSFDLTEIDELLALRILTLTESEKAEMRSADPRIRRLLERTERLSEEQQLGLHGRTTTQPAGGAEGAAENAAGEVRPRFRPGDHVRITPRPGGDVLDLALKGEAATVCSVEQDFEGQWHFAVTVDADPGKDLGREGFLGHRFFFFAEDLEPLS